MTEREVIGELRRLGSATVYEAGGRRGFVDADLHQIVPGSRAAGPARTVRCGQDDNLMVHAAMASLEEGDVLVLTMPDPQPVALFGELLATQAQAGGAAAVLVDAAIRDREALEHMQLPVWARWIRIRGAGKDVPGELDVPVVVGGARIRRGDVLVLDADGVAVVEAERVRDVAQASAERERKEETKRERLRSGELSWEIDGLRQRVGR